jgi:hypothetical protein
VTRCLLGCVLAAALCASPLALAKDKKASAHKQAGKAPPAGVVETSQAPAAVTKPVAAAPASEVSAATAPRGPTRIDFDDRLVQGQSNKSGAVYLFDRKESALRSMVHRRTSFRDEIVKDVLD